MNPDADRVERRRAIAHTVIFSFLDQFFLEARCPIPARHRSGCCLNPVRLVTPVTAGRRTRG